MIKPVDIAIAGVQKAATSSLHIYLGQHPEVITHDEREFSFFVQDDEYEKGYSKIYHSYFPETTSPGKILIKNVGIIYWEEAMQRLHDHNPRVKIILVLRNPVARAYSAFWFAKLRGKETENSFEDALFASEKKTFNKENKALTAYLDRGNYAHQLKTLYKYFSSEQIKIILFEELKEKPEAVINDLLKFCELSNSYTPVVSQKLKGASQPRIGWVAAITNQKSSVKSKIRKLIPGKLRHKLRQKLNKLNRKEFIPPAMKMETKQRLIEHFKPMVDDLSKLIGRDLSHWNK